MKVGKLFPFSTHHLPRIIDETIYKRKYSSKLTCLHGEGAVNTDCEEPWARRQTPAPSPGDHWSPAACSPHSWPSPPRSWSRSWPRCSPWSPWRRSPPHSCSGTILSCHPGFPPTNLHPPSGWLWWYLLSWTLTENQSCNNSLLEIKIFSYLVIIGSFELVNSSYKKRICHRVTCTWQCLSWNWVCTSCYWLCINHGIWVWNVECRCNDSWQSWRMSH